MEEKAAAPESSAAPTPLEGTAISHEPTANEEETRAALLKRSKRAFAVIMKDFVQTPPTKDGQKIVDRAGILSEFVRNGDLRGLRAYLLLCAFISANGAEDGWSATLPVKVWARAFDTTRYADSRSSSTAVSKILGRLEKRGLITRTRKGRERKIQVTLLHPDGDKAPFRRKDDAGRTIPYLKLRNIYWEDWFDKLDLPATAMLLVALHSRPTRFELPSEKVPDWYGWSADTAERGFRKLADLGLLEITPRRKKAALAPEGYTIVNHYRLVGPFAPAASPDSTGGDKP